MSWLRLALVFLALAVSSDAATLHGTVIDSQGAVIPNSHIVVRWDSIGLDGVTENIGTKEDTTATADQTGQFQLDLPPGVYDVFVTAPGFSPHCEKITVKGKGIQPYDVRLKVSRMIKVRLD
jgi:hypothetical protein